MSMVTCDLPSPASPAIKVCLPMATRPGHSHSTGSGVMSDAR
jgi:hypothetical protein